MEAPAERLSALPLLSEAERRELVVEWNATRAEVPLACVHHLFEAQAALRPEAVAVAYEGETLSYGELNRKANQLAHHLKQLGVRVESRVGLFMERSLEAIVGLLGILKAGGAYVPLDPGTSQASDRLAFMLRDAGAHMVVTQEALADELPASGQMLVCLDSDEDQIGAQPEDNPVTAVRPEHLVYVIYTSGSTGQPKGVAIEHRQLASYVEGVSQRLELPEGASFASVSTLAADLGNTAIFPSLCRGGALHLISRERVADAERAGRAPRAPPGGLPEDRPLRTCGPCSAVAQRRAAAAAPAAGAGRGGVDWALVETVHALVPECRVFNHYGPTETTVGVLTHRVPRGSERRSGHRAHGRPHPQRGGLPARRAPAAGATRRAWGSCSSAATAWPAATWASPR